MGIGGGSARRLTVPLWRGRRYRQIVEGKMEEDISFLPDDEFKSAEVVSIKSQVWRGGPTPP